MEEVIGFRDCQGFPEEVVRYFKPFFPGQEAKPAASWET